MSTIFKCAKRDDLESLKKLVEEGADLNETTFNNETALHIAASRNAIKVLNFLLEKNVDVNARTDLTQETPLFLAVQENQSDAFNALISHGANVNAEDFEGETPIFVAIKNCRSSFIDSLIEKGADVNHKNKDGQTPLFFALEFKSTTMVKQLVDAKANTEDECINQVELSKIVALPLSSRNNLNDSMTTAISALGTTPAISHANSPRVAKVIRRNYEERASLLFQLCIENQAQALNDSLGDFDVNLGFFDNETLLHCAAQNAANDCIQVLLDHGANVDVQTKTFMEPPLHTAITSDNSKGAELLINADANIELANAEGETAIFVATRAGNVDIVRALIAKSANVNQLNASGNTPLHAAIQLHQPMIAKLLIENGAAPSLGSLNSYSLALEYGEMDICNYIREVDPSLARHALQNAGITSTEPPPEIFTYIHSLNAAALRKVLSNQYNMNIIAPEGVPLIRAIETGSIDIVKIIVNSGADVNFGDNEYPLHIACKKGLINVVEYLLKQGANPSLTNEDNENALFAAIRSNNQTIISEIIAQDVPLNDCNKSGMSPLYIAVGMKSMPSVKLLLQNGAEANSHGHSPLKLAQDLKATPIINLLINAGAKAQIKRPARKTRQQSSLLSKTQPVRIFTPAAENGKCLICQTRHHLLKLIPCGHVVVCKRCLDKFIARKSQCPLCRMSFYATSAYN